MPSSSRSGKRKAYHGLAVLALLTLVGVAAWWWTRRPKPMVSPIHNNVAIQKAAFNKALDAATRIKKETFRSYTQNEVSSINATFDNPEGKALLDALDVACRALLTKEQMDKLCFPEIAFFAQYFFNKWQHLGVALARLNDTSSVTDEETVAYATLGLALVSFILNMGRLGTSPEKTNISVTKDAAGNPTSVSLPPAWVSFYSMVMTEMDKAKSPWIKTMLAENGTAISQVMNTSRNAPNVAVSVKVDVFVNMMIIFLGIYAGASNEISTECPTFSAASPQPSTPPPPPSPEPVNAMYFSLTGQALRTLAMKQSGFRTMDLLNLNYQVMATYDTFPADMQTSMRQVLTSYIPAVPNVDEQCIPAPATFRDFMVNRMYLLFRALANLRTRTVPMSNQDMADLACHCTLVLGLYGQNSTGDYAVSKDASTVEIKSDEAFEAMAAFLVNYKAPPRVAYSKVMQDMEWFVAKYMADNGIVVSSSTAEIVLQYKAKLLNLVPIQIFAMAMVYVADRDFGGREGTADCAAFKASIEYAAPAP